MHPKQSDDATNQPPLWPLEFTPFEYYYYLDDGASYPTTFPIELHFTGPLERERFRAALVAAVSRHPLLAARVDDSRRIPRWKEPQSDEPHLDWRTGDGAEPKRGRLDLRRQPGLRTWVQATPETARVVFEFHHACCDGLAGLQFVQDFLALYRAVGNGSPTEMQLPQLDIDRLRHRGAIVSDEPRPPAAFQGLRDGWYTLKTWAAILWRTPKALAAPNPPPTSTRDPLAFDIEQLSREESAGLRQVARRLHCTTNDLLLRDLLVAMHRWNREQDDRSPGRLRINVPVCVRTRDDRELPAVNRIGYGFVTAEESDADDPERLLEIVRGETGRIKDWKLALYFLGGLAFGKNLPGVLPWAMKRNRSFATAVLSNVGRYLPDPDNPSRHALWTCDGLTLDWIGGVPPVRNLTRAAVIVIEYGGRTSLCLRTDVHYFDAASARKLLDLFAEQVRRTIAGAAS